MACSAGTTRDFPRKRIYGRAIPEWPGTLSISPRPLLTVYQPLALLGSPLGAGGWEVFPRSGICVPLSPPPLEAQPQPGDHALESRVLPPRQGVQAQRWKMLKGPCFAR